ncbi:MAG TPA: hypothetical protein VFE82_11685 [Ramlibacter sp.]|jgi:hypothetical protein|uniref:hypothetical protein n=1 Tax=Ramlibacter sp. TaxID=1917967 RepID=UPI002D3EC6BE|nr:hypothetical protein [Ramlibacter sp.]HZY19133.1 hypothetical protein [Ramlibacter sp.]
MTTVLHRFASLALAALLAACGSVPVTTPAPPTGQGPLRSVVLVVDTDVIGAAFADYQGPAPARARIGEYQDFAGQFTEGLRAEARRAGLEAGVELVSFKALGGDAVGRWQGRPVLVVRASHYTVRKDTAGRALGWSGDTAWELRLFEAPAGRYATRWSAELPSENLHPALCGAYRRCSRVLAERLFAALRRDGLLP